MSGAILWRQSTAVTMQIGPVLDVSGAEYSGLVIGDLQLVKNGTAAAMAAAATLVYLDNGYYALTTIAGNADTIGLAQIRCGKATYQMPVVERQIVPQSTYDALVTNAANAAGGLCDVQRVNGVSASAVTTIAAQIGMSVAQAGTIPTTGTINTTTPPTAAAIATGIWQDSTAGDFTIAGSIGKSLFTSGNAPGAASGLPVVGSQMDLVNAPNATAITALVNAIWNALTSAMTAVGSIGKLLVASFGGNGANTVTITVQDTLSNPLQGATVTAWNGSTLSATAVSNSSGIAVLSLNSATYTINATSILYNGSSASLAVSGATNHTYQLAPLTITPSTPPAVTAWAYTYDATGTVIQPNVPVSYAMVSLPGGTTGVIVDSTVKTAISGSDGKLQLTGLVASATYQLWKTNGVALEFTTGATTTAINGGIL